MAPSSVKELRKELAILKKLNKDQEERIKLQKQIKDLKPVGSGTARRRRVVKHVKRVGKKAGSIFAQTLRGVEF